MGNFYSTKSSNDDNNEHSITFSPSISMTIEAEEMMLMKEKIERLENYVLKLNSDVVEMKSLLLEVTKYLEIRS